jgi:hypothetical protein
MSQFGMDQQPVHFEMECHSSKLSQQTGLLGGCFVWVEMSCGEFVGGRIVKAPVNRFKRCYHEFAPVLEGDQKMWRNCIMVLNLMVYALQQLGPGQKLKRRSSGISLNTCRLIPLLTLVNSCRTVPLMWPFRAGNHFFIGRGGNFKNLEDSHSLQRDNKEKKQPYMYNLAH